MADKELEIDPIEEAQMKALKDGMNFTGCSNDLEDAAQQWYDSVKYNSDLSGNPMAGVKAGAVWQYKHGLLLTAEDIDDFRQAMEE